MSLLYCNFLFFPKLISQLNINVSVSSFSEADADFFYFFFFNFEYVQTDAQLTVNHSNGYNHIRSQRKETHHPGEPVTSGNTFTTPAEMQYTLLIEYQQFTTDNK